MPTPRRPSENPFARLEGELERLKNEVLYAQAETQNVRRRLEKEKQDAQAYAATGFARDLLSVERQSRPRAGRDPGRICATTRR